MLLEEFIKPLGITQSDFADRIGISRVRLNEIVRGRRGITADTALRLAKALGTSALFWLNGQAAYDLARAMKTTRLGAVKVLNRKPRTRTGRRSVSS
jgi:addiction module HigA family antidote